MLHTVREGMGGPVIREWTADTFDVVARQVCARCNAGWMEHLEREADPYLRTVIYGRARTLHGGGQTLLAAWAVKTALALRLAHGEARPIEVEHYRSMAEAQVRPPPNTLVWLGAYENGRHAFHYPHTIDLESDSGQRAEAYGATFTIRHAAFQVFGHAYEDEVEIAKRGARADMGAQIWPILGAVDHPPRVVIDEHSLPYFVDGLNFRS